MSDSILITGGCGYIGSHIVYNLRDRGMNVVVLDNLSTGRRDAIPNDVPFYQADILDTDTVSNIMREHKIDAVIHMAALLSVEESVREPLRYYRNNVDGARSVVQACLDNNVAKLIFSSTGATYASSEDPLHEGSTQEPTSPYGKSKLMAEQLIRDTVDVSNLQAVILRYFNVAGADPQGRTGQSDLNATHLIARACQAASGDKESLKIFGTDYPTADGTALRDYIHVCDLAEAHRIVLQQNFADKVNVFNCGYGHGYSVKQIADKARQITGIDFPVIHDVRRPGDLVQCVANNNALLEQTKWRPQYNNIDTIISSAWNWYQRMRSRG